MFFCLFYSILLYSAIVSYILDYKKIPADFLPDTNIFLHGINSLLICFFCSSIWKWSALLQYFLILSVFLLCKFIFLRFCFLMLYSQLLQCKAAFFFVIQCLINFCKTWQILIFFLKLLHILLKFIYFLFQSVHFFFLLFYLHFQFMDSLLFSSFSCQNTYEFCFSFFFCLSKQHPMPEPSIFPQTDSIRSSTIQKNIS